MTMKCDRCGNTFVWYDNTMTIGASETSEQWKGCGNAVQKAVIDHSYVPLDWYKQSDMEPIALCPSCMAKLNDWLKGKQERQAKWIYDPENNSIQCDKCIAEYKLPPYERESDFKYCPNCGVKMGE